MICIEAVFLAVILIGFDPTRGASCENGWLLNGNKCFRVEGPANYSISKSNCNDVQTTMVTSIKSKQEDDFLRFITREKPFWFGHRTVNLPNRLLPPSLAHSMSVNDTCSEEDECGFQWTPDSWLFLPLTETADVSICETPAIAKPDIRHAIRDLNNKINIILLTLKKWQLPRAPRNDHHVVFPQRPNRGTPKPTVGAVKTTFGVSNSKINFFAVLASCLASCVLSLVVLGMLCIRMKTGAWSLPTHRDPALTKLVGHPELNLLL